MKVMIAICSSVLMMSTLSAHEVSVKVSLSPAGSFIAKSSKMKGDIVKEVAGSAPAVTPAPAAKAAPTVPTATGTKPAPPAPPAGTVIYKAENLWVKVEDLSTDIALRDEHFHKHLNFEKYPKITFTKVIASEGKGKGILTVNDVKQVVPFTYKEIGPKKLEATMKVKPSAFKLKEAKYMEIGVEDEVEVTAILDV